MGPFLIFASDEAIRQGGPSTTLVLLVAVVALGMVACQGLLMELIRYLSGVKVRAGKKVDVDVTFRQTPPPESDEPSQQP